MKKRTKSGIISAKDIMKGFTKMANSYDIWTLAPIQCMSIEEKTKDWVKWNADWFEHVALRELPHKSKRLERLYNLAAGVINKSDYIYNPSGNDVSNHLGIIGEDTEQTLLDQFFPIVPPIIKTLLGEYMKRDKKIIVDAVDPDSISEMLDFKEKELKSVLLDQAMVNKQMELIKQGIIPTNSQDEKSQQMNQLFQQEMANTQKIANVETKFKKFRTIAAQWGQHFIEKYETYKGIDTLELRLFVDSLVADEVITGLNLFENDFEPLYLEPKKTWVNISPSKTNYSDANSIVNVEFKSIPDIINEFRNKLTDEQIQRLETQFNGLYSPNIMLGTDNNGPFGSGYYDQTRTYEQNAQISVNTKERMSDLNVQHFLNSAAGTSGSQYSYHGYFNDPKLIRVSRIWWASQRRVGRLFRIIDGQLEIEDIDENFIVTEKPVYDKSLIDEETSKTLISGEHVEYTWIPEWRYVVKIGQNIPYWQVSNTNDIANCIYLYGEPLPFQRKGTTNKYEAKPPIEGRRISERNTVSVSMVEHLKPWQIIYNVINNKIIRLLPWDIGPIVAANESSLSMNSLNQEDGMNPMMEFLDGIRDNRIMLNKDLQDGRPLNGRTMQPQVLDISTIGKIAEYLNVGQAVKYNAYESIGVTRERTANIQSTTASATAVQQSVESSVNQTEIYFEIFANKIMPEFWQMVLDYAQHYTTKSEEFSDTYINSNLEKVFFKILKEQLLLKDLHVHAFSKANLRRLMQDLKTLMLQDNTMGATFLDKIKGMVSTTPSEIIEKLQVAEAERLEQEQQKQEAELTKQREQQEFLTQQAQQAQAKEDEHFYAKLDNDRYLAEVKAMGFSKQPDMNADKVPDVLEVEQFRLDAQDQLEEKIYKDRQLRMQQQQFDKTNQLKSDELSVKRETLASNERIAKENKQSADIKFIQQQKNRKN